MTEKKGQIGEGFFRGKKQQQKRKENEIKKKESHHKKTMVDLQII